MLCVLVDELAFERGSHLRPSMGATSVVQPLDLVKTRMQLAGEGGRVVRRNTLSTLYGVMRNEGLLAVYTG